MHAKVMVLAAEYLQYSSWWYGLHRISIGDIMGPRTYRWHYGQQNVQYLCLSFGEGSKMYVCIGGGVGSRDTPRVLVSARGQTVTPSVLGFYRR